MAVPAGTGPQSQAPGPHYLTEPDLSGEVFDELRGFEVLGELVFVLRQSLQGATRVPRSAAQAGHRHPFPVPHLGHGVRACLCHMA